MSIPVELPSRVAGGCLPGLRQELFAGLRQHSDLVLDCSRITHLSPAGQALLVATHRAARRSGVRLSFLDPSDAMITALRRSGLRHLLTAAPRPEDAAGRPGPSQTGAVAAR